MSTSRTLTYAIVLIAVAGLAFYLGRITCPEVENGNDPDPTDPELVLKNATPYDFNFGVLRFGEYKTQVDASPTASPMRLYSAYDIIPMVDIFQLISYLGVNDTHKMVIRKGTNPDPSINSISTYIYFIDNNNNVLNQGGRFFFNELQRCPHNCYPIFPMDYPAPVGSSPEE